MAYHVVDYDTCRDIPNVSHLEIRGKRLLGFDMRSVPPSVETVSIIGKISPSVALGMNRLTCLREFTISLSDYSLDEFPEAYTPIPYLESLHLIRIVTDDVDITVDDVIDHPILDDIRMFVDVSYVEDRTVCLHLNNTGVSLSIDRHRLCITDRNTTSILKCLHLEDSLEELEIRGNCGPIPDLYGYNQLHHIVLAGQMDVNLDLFPTCLRILDVNVPGFIMPEKEKPYIIIDRNGVI
jgi:hypothetical protein